MSRIRIEQFEADSAAALGNSKRLWLLHFFLNAALFAAFFAWLRIPDQRASQILLTVVAAIVIFMLTVWLHASTLTYFQSYHERSEVSLASVWRRTLAHLPAFLLWLIAFAAVLWLVTVAQNYNDPLAGYVRHLLPEFVRSSISPREVARFAKWLFFFVFWFLVPVLLLPLGTQVAARGFRGFVGHSLGRVLRVFFSLRFWILYAVCYVAGIWVPWKLAKMFPRWRDPGTLREQATSAGLRFLVGYLLLITAWLLLASALGRLTAETVEPTEEVAVPEPVLEPPADKGSRITGEPYP